MNRIPAYTVSVATGTVNTSALYVDKYDQLMVQIPAITGVFASTAVQITLRGSQDGTNFYDLSYFDYVNATPKTCVVTCAAAGIYEMPYPGAAQYLQMNFSTATTAGTSLYYLTPKTTY